MTDIFAHPLFATIGQKAFETELYTQSFNGAQIEIMGESPYLNARDAGIELVLNKKHKIEAIHLFNGTAEGFCRYAGPFPFDIDFDMTRAQIREKLGTPAMSMEAGGIGIMAIEHAFDRYENDTHYIRFQFTDEGAGVHLITLG
jgi:hypothetical protein